MNRSALQIYAKLLKNGQIDTKSDTELFLEYKKEEVRNALYDLEEELGFTLLEVGHIIYMIPNLENEVLSYSAKELRESIHSNATMIDSYLQSYIIMLILYMFYGGKNNNPIQRDFLQVKVLIDEIDTRVTNYLSLYDPINKRENDTHENDTHENDTHENNTHENNIHKKENYIEDENHYKTENIYGIDESEERHHINFKKIAQYWTSKQIYEQGKVKTKEGTIQKACRLLEREKLIRMYENNREIRPTQRLQDIFIHYYLNEDRTKEINSFFGKEDNIIGKTKSN